jgi:hypothetical protein
MKNTPIHQVINNATHMSVIANNSEAITSKARNLNEIATG